MATYIARNLLSPLRCKVVRDLVVTEPDSKYSFCVARPTLSSRRCSFDWVNRVGSHLLTLVNKLLQLAEACQLYGNQ
jgi:hypothetical protein